MVSVYVLVCYMRVFLLFPGEYYLTIVWCGCLQSTMCLMMLAVCCHSDNGFGDEAQREQYCEVSSRTYSAQQLNNKFNDGSGTFSLQFLCEIEV